MANGFNDNELAATIRQLFNDLVAEHNAHLAATNNPHGVTKGQIGLGNVDDTSDANKPASNAVLALLAGKYANTNPSNFITVAQALAAVLAGFTVDSGAISGVDTVLGAIQKLYGNQLQNGIDIASLFAGKQDIPYDSQLSDTVMFQKPTMYGTYAAPRNGANVLLDTTDAKLGVKVIMLHNAGAEPAYPAAFRKLNTSKNYQAGVLNFIEIQYFTPTRITYNIYQEL